MLLAMCFYTIICKERDLEHNSSNASQHYFVTSCTPIEFFYDCKWPWVFWSDSSLVSVLKDIQLRLKIDKFEYSRIVTSLAKSLLREMCTSNHPVLIPSLNRLWDSDGRFVGVSYQKEYLLRLILLVLRAWRFKVRRLQAEWLLERLTPEFHHSLFRTAK